MNGAWRIEDAEELYRFSSWSDRFFSVGADGHVKVHASREDELGIDLARIVDDLAAKGMQTPLLLRFHDVLRERVKRINQAFVVAIDDYGYHGRYHCVYPIKVNQLREVVEEILDAGKPYAMGLECGSKAELVAGLVQLDEGDRLLLCNGVKDEDMLRLMLDAQQLGRNVIPIMEKLGELNHFLELADELKLPAKFGVRIRLDAGGAGKWSGSTGSHAKFGLSIPELVDVANRLVKEGRPEALDLLHFHIGSQIEAIQAIKEAVRELSQIYVQLHGMGLKPRYLDVGGGLGVNYGGGYGDDPESGIQYSLQEYANAIVFTVAETCDARDVKHPILVSESGRALTAHHSVLIVDVLGAYRKDDAQPESLGEDPAQPLQLLSDTLQWVNELAEGSPKRLRLLEAWHDAKEARNTAKTLFDVGFLSLVDKANAERLYWAVSRAIWQLAIKLHEKDIPKELYELDNELADHYLCNFSVFQSLLDHWAIGQQFPIVPITRLNEEPTRRAILVDLTCDSDGKISRYVCADSPHYLALHELRGNEPYRLAVFLVGAYQDIMGDTHNLLGRVPEVHIYADDEEPGGYFVEKTIDGMTIKDMLALVQYFPNDLHRRMQEIIRRQQDLGMLKPKVGVELLNRYEALFNDKTYMERRHMAHVRSDETR